MSVAVFVLLSLGEVSKKKLRTGREEIFVNLDEPNVSFVILVFWKNVILFCAYINIPMTSRSVILMQRTKCQ